MKPRAATYSLIIVLICLGLFFLGRWHEPRTKEIFDRHPSKLSYSTHALCRMDCWHVNKEDIEEIMEKGIIIFNRSNRYGRPCPSFVLQGVLERGQHLRVLFYQCREETRVVNCDETGKDPTCPCASAATTLMNNQELTLSQTNRPDKKTKNAYPY
ncbi:MAG: DUF4258 domain-containing protein [Flavisolibacter sp.]